MQVPATIDYFGLPDAPGMHFFRCEKLSATLSPQGCAANYRSSLKRGDAERLHHCRNCPIGALHTGEEPVRLSPYYGGNLCSRCHRPASRIIHGRICVSCQNREYEIIRGRNAKGMPPVKLAPLHPRRLKVAIGGRVVERKLERSVDMVELMLSILRNERGEIRFGFGWQPGVTA